MKKNQLLENIAKATLNKIYIENPSYKNHNIKVFVDYSRENPEIKLVIPGSLKTLSNLMIDYSSKINSVEIQEGIQNITSEMDNFETYENIREVKLPNSLIQIGNFAFSRFINLEKINLPSNLLEIGTGAFSNCLKLKEISLPKSLVILDSVAFASCINLEKVELPNSITILEDSVFHNCSNLKEIKLPNNLVEIGTKCFYNCCSLENIELPDTLKVINQFAFEHCENLQKIKLPKNIKKIGVEAFTACAFKEIVLPSKIKILEHKAFAECPNLTKVLFEYEEGKYYQLSKEIYEDGLYDNDFNGLKNFLQVRDKIKAKFIPSKEIFANTPKNMIENFYKYSKLWAEILNKFTQHNGLTIKSILPQAKEDLYKICFIAGLFQDDYKVRMRAKKFIETKIVMNFDQYQLHDRFSGLDVYKNGYNPVFAEFLIKNFSSSFLNKQIVEEIRDINYFAQVYNNFSEIEKAYPNKLVSTNTNADRLTEGDIFNFLSTIVYKGIQTEQDQLLADLCSMYGYSQFDFNQLKYYMHEGTKIKQEGLENLFCLPDEVKSKNVITYRFLEKGDPLGGLLGEITNCCQTIHGIASSCCKHGMTNPNGGFVVFELDGKIIGQSWVWYDKQSEKICLDNIEVPRSAKIKAINESSDFKNCLKRLSRNFKTAMTAQGRKVSYVTMGAGYNDILDVVIKNFKKVDATIALANAVIQEGGSQASLLGHSPASTYTDICQGEYILE